MRVLLLGCVKRKRDEPAPARDLYCSALWNGRRRFAEASGLPWAILSAEHGLVLPDATLAPYDTRLTSLDAWQRTLWGRRVAVALEDWLGVLRGFTFEVHAGAAYAHAIREPLRERGAELQVPLARHSMGHQLAYYREVNR